MDNFRDNPGLGVDIAHESWDHTSQANTTHMLDMNMFGEDFEGSSAKHEATESAVEIATETLLGEYSKTGTTLAGE